MDKKLESPLYLLPGESRTKDRVLPASMLRAEIYSPSKDMNLTEDQRFYAVDLLAVTVTGEEKDFFPFILPVQFSPDWRSLADFAEAQGRVLAEGDAVKDEDELGRSIIRSWIALADGTVHTIRMPSTDGFVLTEQLPIVVEKKWLDQLIAEHHQVGEADKRSHSPTT